MTNPPDDRPAFLNNLSKVFSRRVQNYGATPAGVLWKDSDGQQLRFEVLCDILNDVPISSPLSINELGCGYGALFDVLNTLPNMPPITYKGYDICSDMVALARQRVDDPRAEFHLADRPLSRADYTFVSGTYNLHIDVDNSVWTDFIKTSLAQLWAMTDKGLAFNMLDKNHRIQMDGLYYADRIDFQNYCATLSANITVIDDYPLDEWTMFIRR